jgi:hypothetical protein
MTRVLWTVAILAISALPASSGTAGFSGIRSIGVIIEDMDDSDTDFGVSRSGLRRAVTRRLKLARIERHEEAHPCIYVRVTSVEGRGSHSYAVEVDFRQRVTTANGERVRAATWNKIMIGMCSSSSYEEVIDDVVDDLVDDLLEDYLDAQEE